MADILELSEQYRSVGARCRQRRLELEKKLQNEAIDLQRFELQREITMLTAMSRDCIATANYLKAYFERRERLECLRGQEAGI